MLLGAWRERAERGDAHEEAQLALLLREAPAHTPASFERALLDYLQMLGYTQLSGGDGSGGDGGGGEGGGGPSNTVRGAFAAYPNFESVRPAAP